MRHQPMLNKGYHFMRLIPVCSDNGQCAKKALEYISGLRDADAQLCIEPGFGGFWDCLGKDECTVCKKKGKKLSKCGGCGWTMYCGKECQKEGWKTHKRYCWMSATTDKGKMYGRDGKMVTINAR
ncbi:hypothetical protein BJ508DRAFT_334866 [Ascobolus immersus RN42]|uniref:MYND-type domain-containing protein n=1 Tax=Ascobolus immersus RN42 TaxID=1160509 RepID=A0A3N4HL61_ASCIM|nr:hypothetical protein BJ508DRAFT_334866 [Ascobolus immersus RN42]